MGDKPYQAFLGLSEPLLNYWDEKTDRSDKADKMQVICK